MRRFRWGRPSPGARAAAAGMTCRSWGPLSPLRRARGHIRARDARSAIGDECRAQRLAPRDLSIQRFERQRPELTRLVTDRAVDPAGLERDDGETRAADPDQ